MNDPSQPWPKERKEVIAGTLEVKNVTEQVNGVCRDINFDPTLVPPELSYQMIRTRGASKHLFTILQCSLT